MQESPLPVICRPPNCHIIATMSERPRDFRTISSVGEPRSNQEGICISAKAIAPRPSLPPSCTCSKTVLGGFTRPAESSDENRKRLRSRSVSSVWPSSGLSMAESVDPLVRV